MSPGQVRTPDFRIDIDGDPIPAALRGLVTGINYQNGMEGADRVELTLANPNLRWLDHPLLQTDNGFELWLGYASKDLERVFVGEITGINATFPSGSMPTLTVVAQDFMHRMTAGSKTRIFGLDLPTIGMFPIPDPIIAPLVSAQNLLLSYPDPVGGPLSFLTLLLTFLIDPEQARLGVRLQQEESDFDFLSAIARENAWDMYIDHTQDPQGYWIRFRFPVYDHSPSLVLKYGESLIDYTPRITNVGQVGGVSARIWIAAIQTELVIVLSWDWDRSSFDLQVYPGIGSLETILGEGSKSVLSLEASVAGTAPQTLLAELLTRLNNRLTGSGSAMGDLRMRAGRVIELEGVGEQFGGKYRLTATNHTIDSSGYRTSFEVRKEVWFGSIPKPKGIGGLFTIQGKNLG
jgi:phage protein D